MEQQARRVLGSAALIVAAILIARPAPASGSCIQTRVTDDFVSPDGMVQGAGVVKICPYWTISPSLRLSLIYFNGRALGAWMLHAGEGGRFETGEYAVILRRLPEGQIALADYYWPGADGRPSAPGLRAALRTNAREGFAIKPPMPASAP
jgi:hypothetical protein